VIDPQEAELEFGQTTDAPTLVAFGHHLIGHDPHDHEQCDPRLVGYSLVRSKAVSQTGGVRQESVAGFRSTRKVSTPSITSASAPPMMAKSWKSS